MVDLLEIYEVPEGANYTDSNPAVGEALRGCFASALIHAGRAFVRCYISEDCFKGNVHASSAAE